MQYTFIIVTGFIVPLSLLKTQKTKTQFHLNNIFLCRYKRVWFILSVHPYLLSLVLLFINSCKIILQQKFFSAFLHLVDEASLIFPALQFRLHASNKNRYSLPTALSSKLNTFSTRQLTICRLASSEALEIESSSL